MARSAASRRGRGKPPPQVLQTGLTVFPYAMRVRRASLQESRKGGHIHAVVTAEVELDGLSLDGQEGDGAIRLLRATGAVTVAEDGAQVEDGLAEAGARLGSDRSGQSNAASASRRCGRSASTAR